MTGISTYDIQSKYKWIPNEDSWGMDVRHILILHNILLFPSFSKVLEIGTHYGPWYDGSMFLKQKLMTSPDWLCLEDSLFREGEKTERGLFFATTKKIIYNEASTVFEYFKHYEL